MFESKRDRIKTMILLFVFTIVGVVEYVQLMFAFDLPQIVLVMPMLGAISYITLRKASLLVPAGMVVLSAIYQFVAGSANAINGLRTSVGSVLMLLVQVLPICLLFYFIGMGGGACIAFLKNKKKSLVLRIPILVAGVVIVLAPYIALFQNPLYPIQARITLNQYADEVFTDYEISEKHIYYDGNISQYKCRVVMSDGVNRELYLDAYGNAVKE